jgi:hypothetical protein
MNKHKVMLFMKGNPSAPKCGFSRQTVGLLREKGIEFAWFDIFSDEDVRQGLKRVNDWPSEWVSSSANVSVSANYPEWRVGRGIGYFQGDGGEWGMGRVVSGSRRGKGVDGCIITAVVGFLIKTWQTDMAETW